MQNIKETIDYFCIVLKEFGICEVDANHFRQAKHDQPQAIIPMTSLLKQICLLDLLDFSCKAPQTDISMEQLLSLLILRGCPSIIQKVAINISSRNLLQIVGQIVAEQDIFNKYKILIVSKLFDQQSSNQGTKNNNQLKPFTSVPYEIKSHPTEEYIKLNQLIIQKQKYFLQLLNRKESTELKLNQIIRSLNIGNFTISQLQNLTNQENDQLKNNIHLLTHENEQIKHQEIFWAWMESVVDEDKKSYRDYPLYGFQDIQQIDCKDDRNLNRCITNKFIQLMVARKDFKQIADQFELEWDRVSQILQVSPEGQEKLQKMKDQIPKIMSQQNKNYVTLEQYLNSSQLSHQLINYDLNELIKREIASINKIDDKNIDFTTDDQLQSYNKKLANEIYELKQSLRLDLKEIILQMNHIFQIYPSLN